MLLGDRDEMENFICEGYNTRLVERNKKALIEINFLCSCRLIVKFLLCIF